MEPFDVKLWRDTKPWQPIEGVVVFAPQYMLATFTYTSLVDPETGKHQGECRLTIQKQEIQLLPDYSEAYRITMTQGFFNANKFGVTLANGVLTGVNAESTPQTPALITSIASLLEQTAAAGIVRRTGAPDVACNAEPKLTLGRYTPK